MWKLGEKVEKADFRHWLDAIDLELEAIHQFKHHELIFNHIRMRDDVIDDSMLNEIREQVNRDLPHDAEVRPIDWDFEEKTRFMFTCIFGRLNTELHGKIASEKNRNSLELYRPVS